MGAGHQKKRDLTKRYKLKAKRGAPHSAAFSIEYGTTGKKGPERRSLKPIVGGLFGRRKGPLEAEGTGAELFVNQGAEHRGRGLSRAQRRRIARQKRLQQEQ